MENPLIGWTEWLSETGQRGLNQPWFEGHPGSLAVRVELPGHPQRFERGCDTSGRHAHQHDLADP
jgi:hypothetical protein